MDRETVLLHAMNVRLVFWFFANDGLAMEVILTDGIERYKLLLGINNKQDSPFAVFLQDNPHLSLDLKQISLKKLEELFKAIEGSKVKVPITIFNYRINNYLI